MTILVRLMRFQSHLVSATHVLGTRVQCCHIFDEILVNLVATLRPLAATIRCGLAATTF